MISVSAACLCPALSHQLNKTVVYMPVCCLYLYVLLLFLLLPIYMEGEKAYFATSYGLDQSSFVSVKTGSNHI